jgi:hypothetical protein
MEPKVIVEQRNLRSGDAVQRIALVYLGEEEHRVYAPAGAAGDPREWAGQISVHKPDGYAEVDVAEPDRSRVIEATFRALEQTKAEALRAEADAPYCEAQICMQGDVQSSDGTPFDPAGHCTKCGAPCINICINCKAPIRGKEKHSAAVYECPSFCHRCGHPYPWMDDKLRTAHDLLFHDDQLTYEERKELWKLLRYVMSSPKAELTPAKSKLISIKIQKAAAPIKDFVTDLLAKYAAEMSK